MALFLFLAGSVTTDISKKISVKESLSNSMDFCAAQLNSVEGYYLKHVS